MLQEPALDRAARSAPSGAGARLAPMIAAGLCALALWSVLHRAAVPAWGAGGPPLPVQRDSPQSWPNSAITIAWLGHATLLMNYLGVRLISDPTFYRHIGLSLDHPITIGPRRLSPAPLGPGELGPLGVILITHAHMDHLDLPSLAALPKNLPVIVCPGCADLVRGVGFTDVRPLVWGQSTNVAGLKITATPAAHWGRRWPWERDRGYNSYVLEKDGIRMLLACDSALTEAFAARALGGPVSIAAFSIGAYDPWIWHHANPEQVWQMYEQSGALYLIPIHWGTFRLSREAPGEPLARLLKRAGPRADEVVMRKLGDVFQLRPAAIGRDSEQVALPQAQLAKLSPR